MKQELPSINEFQQDAIELLKQLIAIPSFSRDEDKTANCIEEFFHSKNIPFNRYLNNVWSINENFDLSKPTILLNSHHDTVKPNKGYTLDPFSPIQSEGKLFGLGSNDAGGCLVSLINVFAFFYPEKDLKYNIAIAATAEEEISGSEGIEALLKQPDFKKLFAHKDSCAIVGEPTKMHMAVAEKGLLVVDCIAEGKAGHAARNEGDNAIYKAMKDIEWLQLFQFPKVSDLLGPVKMTVTSINTENKAHNVVPSSCSFVVDIRVNELYTFEEVIDIIKKNIQSTIVARSTRLKSSSIHREHPLIKAGTCMGRDAYGSPTTSDKALMDFPALKMGPGDSARSHTADEFIFEDEIRNGIELYIKLLKQVL